MGTRPSPRAVVVAAALAGLMASSLAAHQRYSSPRPSPASSLAPSPTPAAAGVEIDTDEPASPASPAPDEVVETAPPEPAESDDALAVIPWSSALTGHLHNKIVHFPLAFGLAAAVMLLVAPRWPAYEPAARILLVVAAVAAVAAYLTGTRQEDQFDDSPFHAVVELHEKFGISTAITLAVGAFLSFREKARRFMPFYAAVLFLLLSATGFLGGVLSHS